jgi:hypothetical protein
MKANKEILEDELEDYEAKLKGSSSFLQELKTTTTKCGTEPQQYVDDQHETEHNIKFYEAEIARLKKEVGAPGKPPPPKPEPGKPVLGGVLPQTSRQGIGSVIFSSIGFVFGALLGSRIKSRKKP